MKIAYLHRSICALLFITFTLACNGQPNTSESPAQSANSKFTELDALISKYADYGDFNGAVLVAEEGKVIYQSGFGFAEMEWEIPNQTNTKFRIGSITKQFTAMLVVQLAAADKIDLHQPISTYLPTYPQAQGDQITPHHLLTHSSGIPNNYESTKPKAIRPDNHSSAELVAEFAALPLEFTPGEKFSYCNAGYTLLGHMVEKVLGQPYEQVLQDSIFQPLNMHNTGFDKHRMLINNRASGYFKSWGETYNANYIDMSSVYAAGGLYSTIEDLLLWDQALYTNQLLPQEYLNLLFETHIADPDYGGHYGYGWSIKKKPLGNSDNQVLTFSHDGVIDGFCAIFTRIPATKSSIILLSNIRRAPLNAMTKGIMGILYQQPYDQPLRSLAYAMQDTINAAGIAAGVSYFQTFKQDTTFYLSEDEMNVVSYRLLESDRAQEAATVLELAITVYPQAFNLYDSYGEVLNVLGQKAASIENYQKSLELNPGNDNARRMLKQLGVEANQE